MSRMLRKCFLFGTLLSLILCVVSIQSDKVCSVFEHREMQADFTNCSREYTEEHFNTDNGDTCHLVKSVVGKCGELWERCHTSREVRRMRDLHIEAFVRQYGSEGGLEGCDLVQKYRQSGRTPDDPVEDVNCSDTKTMDIQTKFQTCSHSTATSVYETIQNLTSVKIISDKLCKALTTIGTFCVKHLNECFAEDDVRQMRKSHLEEMKTFLLRISQGKDTNNAFDNCKVMEYVENVTDPDKDQAENFIVTNTNEQNKIEESKDFPPPDNTEHELKSTEGIPDHPDGLLPPDTNDKENQKQRLIPNIAPFHEEVINEQNENMEHEPKLKELTEISSFKALKIKGARSAEFGETDSASLDEHIESEKNVKDDVVARLNEAELDSKSPTAGDDEGDDINTVSQQSVKYPEEGERLHRASAGGGSRTDSQAKAVIVSLLGIVVMNRI